MAFRALGILALSLGMLGASGSIAADRAADSTLKGDAVCTRCHDETEAKPVLSIYKTAHGVKADARTPGCQTCHGASEAHVKNVAGTDVRPWVDIDFGPKAPTPPGVQTETCLDCHRGGLRNHWTGSEHERSDVTCSSCHAVHASHDKVLAKGTQQEVCYACHKTQRAQVHRMSTHPILAGKVSCSDCHNPHGSTGPKLMARDSVNETCYTCHADRRGPFLWEHTPVTEDCTNCHTPHGSNNPALLKTRVPFLCQQCHTGDHSRDINSAAHLPGGNVTTVNGRQPLGGQTLRVQANARACLNCHSVVHGSNHPAGARLQR